jgi:hypothetical protein
VWKVKGELIIKVDMKFVEGRGADTSNKAFQIGAHTLEHKPLVGWEV